MEPEVNEPPTTLKPDYKLRRKKGKLAMMMDYVMKQSKGKGHSLDPHPEEHDDGW